MLDIKMIRQEPDRVKAAMKTRNFDADALIDEVLAIDVERRQIMGKEESMKAEQNAETKKIACHQKRRRRRIRDYGADACPVR